MVASVNAFAKPPKQHILVVEDERQISRFIELELRHEGYEVSVVANGIDALVFAREQNPDLIVLDLMLPGIDGLEVCRRLRTGNGQPTNHYIPIIMVTAKDAIPDRVNGLKSGADDYLTKPFSIEELLARIEALLRRNPLLNNSRPEKDSQDETIGSDHKILRIADLVVNTATREVKRGERSIELTAKEYELLVFLMRHPRQVLSRDQIYEAVWGYDFEGESNVIEVYIRYLRHKVDVLGPRLIHTRRGAGYVLKPAENDE